MAKALAVNARDIPANTYVYIDDTSTKDAAFIRIVSDSKSPDVLQTAQKRKIGRPKGAQVGRRSPTVPYANGVDLANVLNGRRGGGTSRRTPRASHGWFDKVVEGVFRVMSS